MYVAQLFNTYAQKIQRTSLQLIPYVITSRQGIPIHVAGIGSRGWMFRNDISAYAKLSISVWKTLPEMFAT